MAGALGRKNTTKRQARYWAIPRTARGVACKPRVCRRSVTSLVLGGGREEPTPFRPAIAMRDRTPDVRSSARKNTQPNATRRKVAAVERGRAQIGRCPGEWDREWRATKACSAMR